MVSDAGGGFMDPTNFDCWFRRFCVDSGFGRHAEETSYHDKDGVLRYKRTGYEGLRFHELRHTQATLLIGSGADVKTVQHRLEHSTASLTMDIYAHAIKQNDERCAEAIDGVRGAIATAEEVTESEEPSPAASETVSMKAPTLTGRP